MKSTNQVLRNEKNRLKKNKVKKERDIRAGDLENAPPPGVEFICKRIAPLGEPEQKTYLLRLISELQKQLAQAQQQVVEKVHKPLSRVCGNSGERRGGY